MGKKTLKKRWTIPHVYDVTLLIFETLCPVTLFSNIFIIHRHKSYQLNDLIILFLLFFMFSNFKIILIGKVRLGLIQDSPQWT